MSEHEALDLKTCKSCGQTKRLDEFHRATAARDGRQWCCKDCACERLRRAYQPRGPHTVHVEACAHCGDPFSYTRTMGPARRYCSDRCRHRSGEAKKQKKAGARRCACGAAVSTLVGKPVCPDCYVERTRSPERLARRREIERTRTLRIYGLTPKDWDDMLAAQEGRCACCGDRQPDDYPLDGRSWLEVDHSHATGLVRKLLCAPCNRLLGYASDDPQRLLLAIDYLVAHGASAPVADAIMATVMA